MVKLMYASGKNSNMFYQVRLPIPDPFFFLDTGSKKFIFLDHREYGVFEEANSNTAIELIALEPLFDELATVGGIGPGAGKLALLILRKYGLEKQDIMVESTFPVAIADYLRSEGIVLSPQASLYPERVVKTPEEIAAIRNSLLNTQAAFVRIEEILNESSIEHNTVLWHGLPLTSEMLKIEAEKVLLERDMMNVEGIIISYGMQAAIPHHRGSGEILPNQTIVCDIFPQNRNTGFFADMTRTYSKGKPTEEVQRMYSAVLEVQAASIAAVKPGVSFGSIHSLATQMFLDLGYTNGPEGFTHSIGHGLGLEVHELPFARDAELLAPGNVITIEPGLYYKDRGGVRIEDVIAVTDTGFENLTNFHNSWIIN